MAVFLAEHTHQPETCPASRPEIAGKLLELVSPERARQHGIDIQGEAVLTGRHHLYLIVDAPSADQVRSYFAPFGQLGTLSITAASPCRDVVKRGAC